MSSRIHDLWIHEISTEIPRAVKLFISQIKENNVVRLTREFIENLYPEYKWIEYRGWWNTTLDIHSLAVFFDQVIVLLDPLNESGFRKKYGLGIDDFIELVRDNTIIPILSSQPEEYRYTFYERIIDALPQGRIGWFHRLTETMKSIYTKLYNDVLVDTKSVYEVFLELFKNHGLPEYLKKRGFNNVKYASMDIATRITDLVVLGYRELVYRILKEEKNINKLVSAIVLAHHLLAEPHIDSFGGIATYSETDLEIISQIKDTPIGAFLYYLAYDIGVRTHVYVPRKFNRKYLDKYLESQDIKELKKKISEISEKIRQIRGNDVYYYVRDVRVELMELSKNVYDVTREIMVKSLQKTKRIATIVGIVLQTPFSYISMRQLGVFSPLLNTIVSNIPSIATYKLIEDLARKFWEERIIQLVPYNPILLHTWQDYVRSPHVQNASCTR